jgi:hypothetical protein
MSPELIMLIVSIGTNVLVIFKRVRVCWTPCMILQCRNDVGENEAENQPTFISKIIKRVTPRNKKQENNNNPVNL